jgi:capsular exopolysaccharide synthesis family protein
VTVVEDYLQRHLSTIEPDSFDLPVLVAAISMLNASAEQPAVLIPAEVVGSSVASAPAEYLVVVLGTLLGGLTAIGMIVGLELFQSPIHCPAQIERAFALNCLGALPPQHQRGFPDLWLSGEGSNPAEAESLRYLAASLAFSLEAGNVGTVAIVSPTSGDGRSSLVANLGVALAEIWKDVVILDGDLRSPTLHQYFGADNSAGLSSFLEDRDASLDAIVQETSFQRLRIVPGGPTPINPVELVSSPRMGQILQRLREKSDIVLVDTSPLLTVTDGVLLSAQVEGVIVLVNVTKIGMAAMRKAEDSWKKLGMPVLGHVWVGPGSPF